MGDDALRRYMRALMDRETGATLLPVPGVDLAAYKATLIDRFANPTILDTVERVNTDTALNYLLDPVRDRLAVGASVDLLAIGCRLDTEGSWRGRTGQGGRCAPSAGRDAAGRRYRTGRDEGHRADCARAGDHLDAWSQEHGRPAAIGIASSGPVVLDNLGSHKGARVRKLLRTAGIKLFLLPPYSPDLNPIEEMFSKLKRLLRKANERTVEATWRRIGTLLNRFQTHECANYIRGAGYASI